jgi:hypothetical protein
MGGGACEGGARRKGLRLGYKVINY